MGEFMRKRRRRTMPSTNRYSARLTSKYQATVPIEIREHLHLKKGDQIVYELLPDETVVLRKISHLDLQYFHALEPTLNEWESEDDQQAYKDL
jgi:antitoxin PrlF